MNQAAPSVAQVHTATSKVGLESRCLSLGLPPSQ